MLLMSAAGSYRRCLLSHVILAYICFHVVRESPLKVAESAVSSSRLQCTHGCTDNHHWVRLILKILRQDLQRLFSLVSKGISGGFGHTE